MAGDRRRLRNTADRDRDVERQVVRASGRDIHATLNTANRAREQADQLNLAVEGEHGSVGTNNGLDGLAHVTKNDGARSVRLTNEGGERGRAGGRHVTRWVVADNVAGRRGEIKRQRGGVRNDGGGVEVHAIGLNLANKTLNG